MDTWLGGSIPQYPFQGVCDVRLFYYVKRKGEIKVISTRNKGRYKLKCRKCFFINFYDNDDIVSDEKVPYIVCDGCGKKIELKKRNK